MPGVVEQLANLAARWGLVGIISGRPVAYLSRHLGLAEVPGHDLIRVAGLYGLEWTNPDGTLGTDSQAQMWRAAVEEVAASAELRAPPGLEVERKGLSVTLHWRRAPEVADWAREFVAGQVGPIGLVWAEGRKSLEVRPPVGGNKKTVVADLGAGYAAVAYIGDDRADLEAFDALDDLAARGASVMRVAVASSEGPPELAQRSDLVVDGPPGVLNLLSSLSRPDL